MKRRIQITGEIDSESMREVRDQLLDILEKNPKLPIDVFIDSPGGELGPSVGFADMLLSLDCEIRTYACGDCASGAFLVFLAGDKRYSYPSTMFLAHQPSSELGGTISDRQASDKLVQKTHNALIKRLLPGRTKCAVSTYKRKIKGDWCFDIDIALKKEFVHEVIRGRKI